MIAKKQAMGSPQPGLRRWPKITNRRLYLLMARHLFLPCIQFRAQLREIALRQAWLIPALGLAMEISGWFFFVGLSIYLFHINQIIFGAFVCCACLGCIAYVIISNRLQKVNVCSFVVYMRIKPKSSFIRSCSPGRGR
ncbi:hypothetical protein BGW80DRAFT_724885 [Lactifluus volemus]|nr:hypothetical protein BGW80DRAFT_724885 [Lactifluus volemus]